MINGALFQTGKIVVTPGVLDLLDPVYLQLYLRRHISGDWGELDSYDINQNNLAVSEGERILSSYKVSPTGDKIWIITEADRSLTTFLLPKEY